MPKTCPLYKHYLRNVQKPDRRFAMWLKRVETLVYKKIKLTLMDVPDELYMISYEQHVTPQAMADIVVTHWFDDNYPFYL